MSNTWRRRGVRLAVQLISGWYSQIWSCCTKASVAVIFWLAFIVYSCHDFLWVSRPLFYHKQSTITVSGQVLRLREEWEKILNGSFYASRRFSPSVPFHQWQSCLFLLLPALDAFIASFRYIWALCRYNRDQAIPREMFSEPSYTVPYEFVSAVFPVEDAALKLAVATPTQLSQHRLRVFTAKHRKIAYHALPLPLSDMAKIMKAAFVDLAGAIRRLVRWWKEAWQPRRPRCSGVLVRRLHAFNGSMKVVCRATTHRQKISSTPPRLSPREAAKEAKKLKHFLRRLRKSSEGGGRSRRALHLLMHLGQKKKLRSGSDVVTRKDADTRLLVDKDDWDRICQRSTGLILLIMSPATRVESPLCKMIVHDLISKYGYTVAVMDWSSLRSSLAYKRAVAPRPPSRPASTLRYAPVLEVTQPASSVRRFPSGQMMLPMAPDKMALGSIKPRRDTKSDYARRALGIRRDPSGEDRFPRLRVEDDQSSNTLTQVYDIGGHLNGFKERLMQSAKTIWQTQATRRLRNEPLSAPTAETVPATSTSTSTIREFSEKSSGRKKAKRRGRQLKLTAEFGARLLKGLIGSLSRDLPENQPFFVFGHTFGCVPLTMALAELSLPLTMPAPRTRKRLGSECPAELEQQTFADGSGAVTERREVEMKQRPSESGMWKRLTGIVLISFPMSLPFLCSGLASPAGILEVAKLKAQSARFLRLQRSRLRWGGSTSAAAERLLLNGLPLGLLHPLAARLITETQGFAPKCISNIVETLAAKYNFQNMINKIAFPTLLIHSLDDPLTPLIALPILRVVPVNPFVVFGLTQRGGSGYFLTGFPPKPWFTALAGSFAKSLTDHAETFPRGLLTTYLQRKGTPASSNRQSRGIERDEADRT